MTMTLRPRHVSEEDFQLMRERVGALTALKPRRGGRSGGDGIGHRPSGADSRLHKLPPSPFSLTLTGQLPSGKNRVRIRRDGHHYPEKAFTNWRARAFYQIIQQHPTRTLITTSVRLSCHYYPGDHKTRDVSGQLDALFHLLIYARVLKDDGLIYDVTWRRYPINPAFPRVMLSLEDWER